MVVGCLICCWVEASRLKVENLLWFSLLKAFFANDFAKSISQTFDLSDELLYQKWVAFVHRFIDFVGVIWKLGFNKMKMKFKKKKRKD